MGEILNVNERKMKSFRLYRKSTLNFVFLALCISIWSTMMTELSWGFSDVAFEVISLLIITICGMFGNVTNRFSLFHIRGIRFTKQRLISVLIGILFPISFIIYFMVSDNEFMKYLNTISLHDFITLSVLLIPIMIIISLIMYFSYVVIEPKYSKEKNNEYSEKTEKSLDEYKMVSLTLVCLIAISSIWIKIAFNYDWSFTQIKTEVIVLIIMTIIKIISNLRNKLPWNYSQRLGYSKYLYVCLLIPYVVFILAYLVSPSLRDKIEVIGIQKTISLIVFYSPLAGLLAVIVSCVTKIINKLTQHTKKYKTKQTNRIIKKENVVISIALSLLAVVLIFIYVLTSVLTSFDFDIIIKTILLLIPVGIIIYLAIYYSIITINK